MNKALRTLAGLAIVSAVLYAAELATRDCRLAPYVYDDCMWVWIRTHLGLPASKILRMGVMECVGIVLALVLYFTFLYVFPRRQQAPHADASTI
jgi:hypothetical protein